MEEKPIMQSKSNIIKICIFLIVVICIAIVFAMYLINDNFRNTVDENLLQKEITENTANIIEINSDSNPYINAYDKYITVLSKNVLTLYNQDASIYNKFDVSITEPYMNSKGKYLVLAEKNGSKIYLISDFGINWEKDIDGEIYRVSVNSNGYVTVLLKNTTYKSVIIVFDNSGEELFRTYLATSHAICSEISENNKYLAVGQIDYSGTIVKSVVKLISIDLAKNDPQNSVLNTYESESNKILNNIQFNSKDEAICMFNSYIEKITDKSDEKIYDINDNSIFIDINLENNVVIIEKESSGLFSYKYQMNLINTAGKSDSLYILDNDVPKYITVSEKLICMNLINEVRIVNSNGWLLKKYTTNSEIQNIVAGESVVGIVYNNKIEIINI